MSARFEERLARLSAGSTVLLAAPVGIEAAFALALAGSTVRVLVPDARAARKAEKAADRELPALARERLAFVIGALDSAAFERGEFAVLVADGPALAGRGSALAGLVGEGGRIVAVLPRGKSLAEAVAWLPEDFRPTALEASPDAIVLVAEGGREAADTAERLAALALDQGAALEEARGLTEALREEILVRDRELMRLAGTVPAAGEGAASIQSILEQQARQIAQIQAQLSSLGVASSSSSAFRDQPAASVEERLARLEAVVDQRLDAARAAADDTARLVATFDELARRREKRRS